MDTVFKTQVRTIGEQLHMIHHCDAVLRRAGRDSHLDLVGGVAVGVVSDQFSELPAAFRRDHIVRVHPENILAPRLVEALVARLGETVGPGELENSRAALVGDLTSAIFRPGVHDDHLIHEGGNAAKAIGKASFLVPCNHA